MAPEALKRLRRKYLDWRFPGSAEFWIRNYDQGGNSGEGSYGRLAEFKARVLNAFVREHGVQSVIEFGCGDGNQLALADYPRYIGLDVAPGAIRLCAERFRGDSTKSFFCYDQDAYLDNLGLWSSDLGLSLDVVYHLVEDDVYDRYLKRLFEASSKWVIIYGLNDVSFFTEPYSRPRRFTDWVEEKAEYWRLDQVIKNEFPPGTEGGDASWSDFYVFRNTAT